MFFVMLSLEKSFIIDFLEIFERSFLLALLETKLLTPLMILSRFGSTKIKLFWNKSIVLPTFVATTGLFNINACITDCGTPSFQMLKQRYLMQIIVQLHYQHAREL